MGQYYGVVRSSEYLAHYGVKGMRWGVRKAIERGDKKALYKHAVKAKNKLDKLKNKVSINRSAEIRYLGGSIGKASGAVTGVMGGLTGGLIANEIARNGGKIGKGTLPMASFFLGPTAGTTAIAAGAYLKGKKRMSAKGHAKNVKKVQEFANEASKAFKGTVYAQDFKKDRNFNDEYKLIDLVKNNKTGDFEEKEIARIKGSHLTSEYKGADKNRFLKLAGQSVSNNSDTLKSLTGEYAGKNSKTTILRSLQQNTDWNTIDHDPMQFAYYMNKAKKRSERENIPLSRSSRAQYSYAQDVAADEYDPRPFDYYDKPKTKKKRKG